MEVSSLAQVAEELLIHYRELLLVDRFFSIKIEIIEGDYTSCCIRSKAALSWDLRLNPTKHNNIEDIQYSVIEGLLYVLFEELDISNTDSLSTTSRGLIARLATAISGMGSIDSAEPEEQE